MRVSPVGVWLCAVAAWGVAASTAWAQRPQAATPTASPRADAKRARATRIPNNRITIDGTLDESEWQQAMPASDFVQQQPREGQPSTHATQVRFLYDDTNLYIGGTMTEDELGKVIVNDLKRDFTGPRDGDLFIVNLDTFSDRLNAYNFQTNAGCALRDSQSYDDGRTINANWDAVWTCRSAVGTGAWYVEIAVPFKQLRFPAGAEQAWGLQVFRLIRHSNEQTLWSPAPRQFNQFKMSYGGVLDGIANVSPGRNIRVKPFFTSQTRRTNTTRTDDADGGVDLKVGVGPNLVFDGTYRTDFSQVEADAQQVNLTRFSLFFPEKREFFLENQGAFQVGPPANNSSNLVPFFSRTIGLSDTGTPIPIVGGTRQTGKVGRNSVGFLNMQTEQEERPNGLSPLPSANVTVARYGREFLANSLVGGFVMDKERGGVSNRVAGADLRFYPTRQWNIDALFMHSTKTGVDDGDAWRAGVQYDSGLSQYTLNYTSLGATFKDDVGFIPRQGVDILNANVLQRFRPTFASRWVREMRAQVPVARYTRDPVHVETQTVTPTFTVELSDSSSIDVNVQSDEEALSNPFRPQGIPAGTSIPVGRYTFTNGTIGYNATNAKRISPNVEYRFGQFYSGTRRGFTVGGRVRVGPKLSTTLNVSRDHIDLPNGVSFSTTLTSLRVDASFSTRMFLSAFIQHNAVTRQLLSNVRYDFIHRPLSDLFLVYNDTQDTNGLLPTSRALVLKYTHLLSF